MRLDYNIIKNLKVFTVSGNYLGKVKNIIIETEGQILIQYEVKICCFSKVLLINRDQIVSFLANKIIVSDSFSIEKGKSEKTGAVSPSAEPVVMRENN